ncbi:MAG: SGNH/GDSL hydrolase family protein [Bacteroidales bacterium]|nr:SGNH/GDSL hydrolase family protein [Bacteroidales bacterium]
MKTAFKAIILLSFLLQASLCAAQETTIKKGKKYIGATELTLGGKLFPDTPDPYCRMDFGKHGGFNATETERLKKSSGIYVTFNTNSTSISVMAEYRSEKDNLHNAYNAEGFDCYIKKDGRWLWAGCGIPDGKEGPFNVVENMDRSQKECLLYFPLYSELESVRIGVDERADISAGDKPFRYRIGVYGSSYTHGGYVSRPGLTYPARLARKTGLDFLSLGVSGVCRFQPAFLEALKDADVDAYLFDTFSNGGKVSTDLLPFIEELSKAKPGVPLIFMNSIRLEKGNFDIKAAEGDEYKFKAIDERMAEAVRKYPDVYFISPVTVSDDDHETSVDGVHPGDYGIMLWVESVEKPLRKILRRYGIR